MPKWDIDHLHTHLQFAVDLEFWTIPFYMSAMYSIRERTAPAYQLIRSVINQEMLHLQSAANIANAYGLSPTFAAPKYEGDTVPHLDFSGDNQKIVERYSPYTAEIGPLDAAHINAMCLIEVPEDLTGEPPELREDVTEYGSIGQFYQALRYGANQLAGDLRGGVRQVDFFAAFYRDAPSLTVSAGGREGLDQVDLLIDLITDQGEGCKPKGARRDKGVLLPFRNTADDTAPEKDHFEKFDGIDRAALPPVFDVRPAETYGEADLELQAIVVEQFTGLRRALKGMFGGENPPGFFPAMASVGAAVRNCWQNGVTPRFS